MNNISNTIVSGLPYNSSTVSNAKTPNNGKGSDNAPVTEFLVKLGLIVLHTKQDWMEVDTVCELARKHNIQLKDRVPGRDELEAALTAYFTDTDEMVADGVVAEAWIRKVKWEWVFLLRFQKCSPSDRMSLGSTSAEEEN